MKRNILLLFRHASKLMINSTKAARRSARITLNAVELAAYQFAHIQKRMNGAIKRNENAVVITSPDDPDLKLNGLQDRIHFPHAHEIPSHHFSYGLERGLLELRKILDTRKIDTLIIRAHGFPGGIEIGIQATPIETILDSLVKVKNEVTGNQISKQIIFASCNVAAINPSKPKTANTLGKLAQYARKLNSDIIVSTTAVYSPICGHFLKISPQGQVTKDILSVPLDIFAFKGALHTKRDRYRQPKW
jgi:hypothetical protein